MTPDLPLLIADNLACKRGGRLIFEGLGFSVPAGGALFLLGPNGSGKSSLLRLLAGLLPCHAGQMTWDGQLLGADRESHQGRLQYVGHQEAVKPVLSVAENLLFWARLHQPDSAPAAIDRALARMGLLTLADQPGRLLSAGQKRRLALARLLAAPAPLWLLDEPSVGLDHDSLVRLEAMIAEHRERGGVVILSTHAEILVPEAPELRLDRFAAKADPLAEIWA